MITGRDVPHGSFGKKVVIYLSAIFGEKEPAHRCVQLDA